MKLRADISYKFGNIRFAKLLSKLHILDDERRLFKLSGFQIGQRIILYTHTVQK